MNKIIAICALVALQAGSACMATAAPVHTKDDRQKFSIYVDENGVLRRSDTDAEVAYYGTNYTVPFAHAYRALGQLGVDRKEAIRRDVYHMARLGFNAFRLHLWDVELSDAQGNLQENEHLELLDFLIAELENRGIDIVLTAQTNFGNGYPDKDIDTGAYSYDFAKCEIHEDPVAQQIQENYLGQLASHINPYTGRSYAQDRAIIAMEVNNEPCHSGTSEQVTAYINRMVKALRDAGFDKPILYNVSHNPAVTDAYYKADIQGTTFQWYPTGLVAGRQRHGNFLPNVSSYPIPWEQTMPGYADKAKFIYEFDPGDVLVSNLYPAIVRTLRGKGFQWITQFAYDPTDMARFNTEYQTHFLNLAYTPAKAISMLIAAQAMQQVPRGADYGPYPANNYFGDFAVYDGSNDYTSTLVSPTLYYYSGNEELNKPTANTLEHIAGVGSSYVVDYEGSGAYFLDKLDDHHWRLEVMPDVQLIRDPFMHTSLDREVAQISYTEHPMEIRLPQLGSEYHYVGINDGNMRIGRAEGGILNVYPGVYLLSAELPDTLKWTPTTPFSSGTSAHGGINIALGEYVAPPATEHPLTVKETLTPELLQVEGGQALIYPGQAPVFIEAGTVPDGQGVWLKNVEPAATTPAAYRVQFTPSEDDVKAIIKADLTQTVPLFIDKNQLHLVLTDKPLGVESIEIGLMNETGITYATEVKADMLTQRPDGMYEVEVSIDSLKPSATWLMPAAYPWFTPRTWDGTRTPNLDAEINYPAAAVITLSGLKKDMPVDFLLHALLLK
ncbi:MAG: cellulase family glycosylhydrolase [Muribaculaceae bacterium]|nr:cellulase family glycosylhydrolase [Muribaculaceae bacterium]